MMSLFTGDVTGGAEVCVVTAPQGEAVCGRGENQAQRVPDCTEGGVGGRGGQTGSGITSTAHTAQILQVQLRYHKNSSGITAYTALILPVQLIQLRYYQYSSGRTHTA